MKCSCGWEAVRGERGGHWFSFCTRSGWTVEDCEDEQSQSPEMRRAVNLTSTRLWGNCNGNAIARVRAARRALRASKGTRVQDKG